MPAPKSAHLTNPDNAEQYRRFVETSRELEADESPDAMDRAFGRVVKPRKGKKNPQHKDPTAGG